MDCAQRHFLDLHKPCSLARSCDTQYKEQAGGSEEGTSYARKRGKIAVQPARLECLACMPTLNMLLTTQRGELVVQIVAYVRFCRLA